jgi:hypothetical protein
MYTGIEAFVCWKISGKGGEVWVDLMLYAPKQSTLS